MPPALEFEVKSARDLINTKTYVVGHPLGTLKKWNLGTALTAENQWIGTDNFIFHGNSGSPLLNEQGKIVGIFHSGEVSDGSMTKTSVKNYSYASPSELIIKTFEKEKGTLATSLNDFAISAEPITLADYLPQWYRFYTSRTAPIFKDNTANKSLLNLLGEKCDGELKSAENSSYGDFNRSYEACQVASQVIDCDNKNASPASICPGATEKTVWQTRLNSLAESSAKYSGRNPNDLFVHAAFLLETTEDSAKTKGLENLNKYLSKNDIPLDFSLAIRLLSLAPQNSLPKYKDTDLKSYVLNYESIPSNKAEILEIARSAMFLRRIRAISKEEFKAFLEKLMANENTSLKELLHIELIAYNFNILQ